MKTRSDFEDPKLWRRLAEGFGRPYDERTPRKFQRGLCLALNHEGFDTYFGDPGEWLEELAWPEGVQPWWWNGPFGYAHFREARAEFCRHMAEKFTTAK